MTKFWQKNLNIDSDHDGLTDNEEKNIFGSDPRNPDTDGDGMNDGDEVKKGRNPNGSGLLKDLFIPNAGNDYQPHSLRPKRIIFHITSAIAIKLVVVFFVLIYPLSAWMTPDVAKEQSEKIIALTNKLRSSLSLPVLAENNKLNQAASDKVENMFIDQYFAHVSPKNIGLEHWLVKTGYEYIMGGENLAMGYNDPEDVMKAWKNSPTHYSNIIESNFKDIGVCFASGVFNKGETVFIAQYFGRQKYSDTEKENLMAKNNKPTVKIGAKINVANNNLAAPLVVDKQKTKVTIDEPVGKKETIIKVEAALVPEVKSAVANVMDKKIKLIEVAPGDWQGQAVLAADNKQEKKAPIVPATLSVINNNGQKQEADLNFLNIKPQATSLFNQYQLFKDNPNKIMERFFDISSIYFKILLILAFMALLFNVFIEIKKQHKHLIISGLGLVCVLVLLIIF